MYIDQMQKLGCSSFIHIQNKRFDCFDAEMATATAKAFEKESTSGKHEFVIYFSKVWTRNISSPEIQAEDSIVGFSTLLAELQALLSRINTGKRTFSVVHTESFIREVNVLVEKLGSKLAKTTENNGSKSQEDNVEDTVENTAGDTAEHSNELSQDNSPEEQSQSTSEDHPSAPAPNDDNPPACNRSDTGDNLTNMSPSENEDTQ